MAAEQAVHAIETEDGDTAVLSYAPLDPATIEASCRSTKDGAVVSFVGYTRDEFQGRTVTRLTYESYVPLALRTLQQILVEARALPPPPPTVFSGLEDHRPCCGHAAPSQGHQHEHRDASEKKTAVVEVSRIRIAHLLGESPPLTPSICISVASPHRREAFYVCEWVLEAVKRKAQVWKREWYASETVKEQEESFVGRDGEGPDGRGGRAHQDSKWKENFPPPAASA
ncbi:hypothetical protein JCM8115_001894 [Rhodotorula mucilaginosa]|uniref:Molybdopterin synthase catalytic subunit n=1 Tax=Rhodotorula mucilaginosa TaxID=5537 RepID=A0A9P6W5B5_RHOMI|nr:Molybdopterin synthase catalytic subunit [Rhodotorula mucilaginosa]TKA53055.1 hypothetical protein B0A53_03935 [Rhodotorula sp. CCFEE 5036]